MTKKILTLVLVEKDGEVLLGMKKRGFGAGKWNGFGGKVEEGETILSAAIRELKEECGIEATNLTHRSVTKFFFDGDSEALEVHIFSTNNFSGEPSETEEMLPRWYTHANIPYAQMWVDDQYWLPKLLQGEKWNAEFHFNTDGSEVVSMQFYPFQA